MISNEYFGFGSLDSLKKILDKEKVSRIFLVTGSKSFALSGAEEKLSRILKGYNVFRYINFNENPQASDINKAIKTFTGNNYDMIVAVGGGSVIDTAKLVKYFSAVNSDVENYIKTKAVPEIKRTIPLIAIPTTSGSGSEATHFAVVFIDKYKHSIANKNIKPDYCIVDPELSMSAPPFLTATTGMDALCQAIESHWSVNSTDVSKTYSVEAIRLIMKNLRNAVQHPDKESRGNMAKAALLAGKAINISKTTVCHALSYPLTICFGVKHGHAVGLTIGEAFILNYDIDEKNCNDPRGFHYVKENMKALFSVLNCSTATEAKETIKELMEDIGLPTKLEYCGLAEADILLIVKNVNTERLNNNPRSLSESDLIKMLRKIY